MPDEVDVVMKATGNKMYMGYRVDVLRRRGRFAQGRHAPLRIEFPVGGVFSRTSSSRVVSAMGRVITS